MRSMMREVEAEIHVNRLGLDAVMPVMVARGDDDFAEVLERGAEVGVDEGGVEIHVENVELQRGRFVAHDVHGDDGGAAQDDDLEEVHARASHPVHDLRGVMHGVEIPEERDAVERAMDPVLHEVGEDHDLDELERDGLAGDGGCGRRAPLRVRDERERGPERGVGEALHHHAADEV